LDPSGIRRAWSRQEVLEVSDFLFNRNADAKRDVHSERTLPARNSEGPGLREDAEEKDGGEVDRPDSKDRSNLFTGS
jgi:hypothetical protein